MDLDPHWSLERHVVRNAELPRTADVVVVGGGLVGVCAALALAESGRRPLILEAEQLAARASGRNGGLLIPGGAESYGALRERWGKPAAQRVYGLFDAGARGLADWIEDYRIDCAWRAEGALRVAATGDQAAALATETVALVEDGFDAAWAPLGEMGRWLAGSGAANGKEAGGVHGALVLPHGGAFHSGLLVTGLARHAVDRGATLAEEEPVLRIDEGPHGVEVVAKRGRVSADAVVIVTNVQVAELLPGLAGAVTPVRGQVLATAPLPSGTVRGAWSVNEGYEYLQQLPDGRVVAGGMRWTAADREMGLGEPEVNPAIQERIEVWLAALLAGLEVVVERRWAGIMAFTQDRLPLVGRVPETERQLVAAAFNGHGVPAAHMAAQIVTVHLNGEALPEGAQLMSPGRPGWAP